MFFYSCILKQKSLIKCMMELSIKLFAEIIKILILWWTFKHKAKCTKHVKVKKNAQTSLMLCHKVENPV